MKLQDAKRRENHSLPSRSFHHAGKHAGSRLVVGDSLHRIPGKRKSKTHRISRGVKLRGALAGLPVIRCGWRTGMGKGGSFSSLLRLEQGFSSSPFSHLGLGNSLQCTVEYSATSITMTTRRHYHHPPSSAVTTRNGSRLSPNVPCRAQLFSVENHRPRGSQITLCAILRCSEVWILFSSQQEVIGEF